MEAVQHILPLLLQISLALIVSSVGMQSEWRGLVLLMNAPSRLLRAVLAVNVVVPVVAGLLVLTFPVSPAAKAGILLMAASPFAPFVPGKMIKSGADPVEVAALYAALMALTVVFVPVTLKILSLIFPADASLPIGSILRFVVMSVFLPLLAGLVLARVLPNMASRAATLADLTGKLLLLPILVVLLYRAGPSMAALIGDGTLAIIAVIVAIAIEGGHLLGRPDPTQARALAMAASARHPGMAAIIANRNFDDPRVTSAILLFLFASIVFSAVYTAISRRWRPVARATLETPT